MMKRMTWTWARLLLIGAIAFSAGCAATPKSETPQSWPAKWEGRTAYSTEHAVIYAANQQGFEEIARLAADIAADFAKRSGGKPTRGLILASDVDDTSLGALPLDTIAPSTLVPPEIRDLKIERREMLLASPIQLSREQVSTLGFGESANTVAWSIALPTRKRMEKTGLAMLDATLANPELGTFEKALINGFKPMFAACIADTIDGTRESILYIQYCQTQPDWDPARKAAELKKFSPSAQPSMEMPDVPRAVP